MAGPVSLRVVTARRNEVGKGKVLLPVGIDEASCCYVLLVVVVERGVADGGVEGVVLKRVEMRFF